MDFVNKEKIYILENGWVRIMKDPIIEDGIIAEINTDMAQLLKYLKDKGFEVGEENGYTYAYGYERDLELALIEYIFLYPVEYAYLKRYYNEGWVNEEEKATYLKWAESKWP